MKVLVVEDDPRIADVLEYALKAEGHAVMKAERGREAIEKAERATPDLIVLDVGLPDLDGFEVCRSVRKFSDVPVIFLTSRSDEIDRVVGLEIGGDDYVVKPFSPRELLARIKAIRRRHDRAVSAPEETSSDRSGLRYGLITIDPEKFRVTSGNREIVLTAQEFKLLELLVRHPGRVFTRAQVLNRAWGDGGLVTDRTIDVHVKSLRKKFGKFDFIETVRGIGYRAREL